MERNDDSVYPKHSDVEPDLFSREKRIVISIIVTSAVLFYSGALFAYWVMIPLVFLFLGSVLLSLIFEKRRKAREAEREESEEEES